MTILSTVVLTKNLGKENREIEKCLKSLEFCEEIVVVCDVIPAPCLPAGRKADYMDSRPPARNATHSVAGGRGNDNENKIKIFYRKLEGDFAAQRNFGIKKVSGEWVLFIDSDEIVSEELANEIKEVMSYGLGVKGKTDVFYIHRRDFFWGKELKYGETSSARNKGIIRLVKKGSGKWEGRVHERFMIHDSRFKNKTLNSYLNHYPHQTVKEFIESVNFYSSLRVDELYSQGKKTNIFEIIFYPLGKFIYTYFFKLGFLDGSTGFVYSFMMSFHSFLVRIKLYQSYIKKT